MGKERRHHKPRGKPPGLVNTGPVIRDVFQVKHGLVIGPRRGEGLSAKSVSEARRHERKKVSVRRSR